MGSADVVLTSRVYHQYLARLGLEKLVCERCGKELHIGEEIHRAGSLIIRKNQWPEEAGNPNCRFYHAECFEGLYIEC
jgi:hypothetical protein